MLEYAEKLESEPQSVNPYAAPIAELEVALGHEDVSDAEQIRNTHLKHEASVKSIGTLYYIAAGLLLLVCLTMTVTAVSEANRDELPLAILLIGCCAVIMVLSFVLGRGLRRLAPWVKIPVTLLCVVGLTSVPVGTIVNAYILYLLHCQKGKTVLSTDYQNVIGQTPHIKYKTSRLVIAVAVILLVALAWGVGVAVFAS